MSESDIKTKFIPILMKASEETVPNIRFCWVRVIYNIKRIIDQDLFEDELREIINKLKEDKDEEVHFWIKRVENIH